MPYKSIAQQRYFNANREKLEKEGVDVDEWNKSTGDKNLPKRIGETKEQKAKKRLARGMRGYKR